MHNGRSEKTKLLEKLAATETSARLTGVTEEDLSAHADRAGYGWWQIGDYRVTRHHDSTAPIETATSYRVSMPKAKRDFLAGATLLTTPEEKFGMATEELSRGPIGPIEKPGGK